MAVRFAMLARTQHLHRGQQVLRVSDIGTTRDGLAAGQPLRLADRRNRYQMGYSPPREALNRLQSARLVTVESLRGFRVAPLALAEMQDAVATRGLIETKPLRAAIRPWISLDVGIP